MEAIEANLIKSTRKTFFGGNWKCNGTKKSISELVNILNSAVPNLPKNIEVVVAPSFVHLDTVSNKLNKFYKVAAQNCSSKGYGAYTGHSERRQLYNETDSIIAEKIKFALKNGLHVIACFGETLEERKNNKTLIVIQRQLEAFGDSLSSGKVVLAYEPVWAIGTGLNATPEQAQEVHAFIRGYLSNNVSDVAAMMTRIIYGGSVKGSNAKELLSKPDIDGFLVGGASLTKDFVEIMSSKGSKNSKL